VCSYYKKVDLVISLNTSLADFNNNVNNIKDQFIQALANAGGVTVSNVVVNGVTRGANHNRRAKPSEDKKTKSAVGEVIDVHSTVIGTLHLENLDKALAALHLKATRKSVRQSSVTIRVRRAPQEETPSELLQVQKKPAVKQ
jgi:hypothetical protein